MAWYDYPPYVPAAERKRRAAREIEKRRKKGLAVAPVTIEGRAIARSFWGKSWCEHLEAYSDYESRLPRGRTYVRNGSVLHLAVSPARIDALVQGTALYEVSVDVTPLPKRKWEAIVASCSGQIDSMVELLRGKMSDGVMRVVTDRDKGLFPSPAQIEFECSCPDSASMCKHVAAVLYGLGARLDERPELLFALRKVDHLQLLSAGVATSAPLQGASTRALAPSDLSDVFGIEIEGEPSTRSTSGPSPRGAPPARPPAPRSPGPPRRRATGRSPSASRPRGRGR